MKDLREELGITHTAPDLDAVTTAYFWLKYGPKKIKTFNMLFFKGGNEALNSMGAIFLDMGKDKFDHHRDLGSRKTSAELVAEYLEIAGDKNIQPLLKMVNRSDLQGISWPFDIADITKCFQRNKEFTDKEKFEIGLRIIDDTMIFREMKLQGMKLQRDNHYAQKIIVDFLAGKKKPKKFLDYLRNLNNVQFQRPFDFVEILVVERILRGEREAVSFSRKLLEAVHKDASMFYEAQMEVKRLIEIGEMVIEVKDQVIVAGVSENSKFNTAARVLGATIIIQRTNDGHNQIYFKAGKVNDQVINTLISMIRLEECLIQGRGIPYEDLRQGGTIEKIPEWYYYQAPRIDERPPGRFIQNGSLTAPGVLVSKILLEILFYLAWCAVWRQPFNWLRWKAERIAYYQNQKQKGKRNA